MKKKKPIENVEVINPEKNESFYKALAKRGQAEYYCFVSEILKYKDVVDTISFEICSILQKLHTEKNHEDRRLLLLASKDTFKTTLCSIGYPLWRLIQDDGRLLTCVLGNAELSKSQSFLREIKWHLQYNETFIKCYGRYDELADKWSEKTLAVHRKSPLKEPTIEATAMGVSMTSQHPKLLILDDWANDKNSRTRGGLETQKRTLEQILAIILNDGVVVILGHRFAPEDMYKYLLEDSDDKEKWKRCCYYAPAFDEKTGEINYPNRFTRESLEAKRREIGTAFYKTYFLLDPSGLKGKVFKLDWARYVKTFELPKDLITFMASDLATGENPENPNSDYYAICRIGIDLTRRLVYLMNIIRGKAKIPTQITEIKRLYREWKPEKLFVESNQAQVYVVQAIEADPTAKDIKYEKVTNTTNKEFRIESLSLYFERGVILIVEEMEGLKDFLSEYLDYPATHDDQLDVIEMCIRKAFEMIEKIEKQRKIQEKSVGMKVKTVSRFGNRSYEYHREKY